MNETLGNEHTKLLSKLQVLITGVSLNYYIDAVKEIACVRCSGSTGRYVYEKNRTVIIIQADLEKECG